MNEAKFWHLFFGFSICCALIAASTSSAGSQVLEPWSRPEQLNLLSPDDATAFPDAVADGFGRVHVVTVRNPKDQDADYPNGLVYYTRWDGAQWTQPIDILAAPGQTTSRIERLRASPDGQLHLLWLELNGGLYWSRSTSLDATSALAWTTERIDSGATLGDLVVASDREIDLVYVANNRDIFFRRTTDGGVRWSPDVTVWRPQTDRQATFTVRFEIDSDGVYHLVWTETDQDLGWEPSGVWYARSVDQGQTWHDSYHVPDQGSFINVGFDGTGNVHLLWDHSVGSEDGRYHAISSDGGVTWSAPQSIFPGLSGRTGFPRMILDGAGQLHQLTSGRGNGLEGGVYHSTWLDGTWNDPVLISDPVSSDNNEGPAAAVTNGNHLHVVYRNVFEIGDILYTDSSIDAPHQASESLPAIQQPTTSVAEVSAEETRRHDQDEAVDSAISGQIGTGSQSLAPSPPPSGISQGAVALMAVIPVVLLLGIVIVVHRRRV